MEYNEIKQVRNKAIRELKLGKDEENSLATLKFYCSTFQV